MRCLVLSRYGLGGASSRVRFAQYFNELAIRGIECHMSELLPDAYLPLRYRNSPWRFAHVLRGYAQRLVALLARGRYDVAWVEGELYPGLPAIFEDLLALSRIPYLVDYDDALFHKYDALARGPLRILFSGKFCRLLSRASGVTAGNAYLEELSRQHGASAVTRIPSVVDAERYQPAVALRSSTGALTIGWIGSPHTTKHLWLAEPALRRLAQERPLELLTVGAAPLEGYGVPVRQYSWSLDSEIALIESMDIGIMPLADEPWERGKCGYKLIQYMALAKPVVASPVGVNCEIVEGGVNGYLAAGIDDWTRALRELGASPELRAQMGHAGRSRVVACYSVQAQVDKVARLLRDAAGGTR